MLESIFKTDLLSDQFDGKQFSESVDQLLTCRLLPRFTTFAFRSSEVRRLLFDLGPYGVNYQLDMFPLFFKRTVDVLDLVLV